MINLELEQLKKIGEAPEFLTNEGLKTLSAGYLLKDETPKQMYRRLAKAGGSYYKDSHFWEEKFFDAMWKNWLCPSSPICANFGSNRGLPISCLTGDTWLNTKIGGIQMKDVSIGDELLTHKGRFKKVTGKKSRMSSGDLYEIKVGTRLTKTKITGNHQVLTNMGWVRVDQLKQNEHFIATNESIDAKEIPYTIDMKKFIDYDTVEKDGCLYKTSQNKIERKKPKNGIVSYYSSPKSKIPVTNDVAWAIGIWCAEGSKTVNLKKNPNGIRITMGNHEIPTVEKFIKIMKDNFNLNGDYYNSEVIRKGFAKGKPTRWTTANINGGSIGRFFCEEFGINCKTKTLPEWLIDLPKEQLVHFLNGLIMGDGHERDNGTWTLVLSNPKLLLGIYNICLKLGLKVSLQMQAKASKMATTKYVYRIDSIKYDSIKLSKNNAVSGISFGDGLRYCPIISLEHLKEDEEVFDISVEEDESFSASGFIVHNCNTLHVGDNVDSIFMKNHELAVLSKNGAGVGIYFGDIRGRGASIKGNGASEGVVPWGKVFDVTTVAISQGSTRKGASAIYLPIDHPDIEEFINIRRPTGDMNRRCLNINHGVCITDVWMESMLGGDENKRNLYKEILRARVETGEPYIFFTDNVNNNNPECYKKNNLTVKCSNICVEIQLFTDPDHTFVCCLSSLNLARWDEWKDSDVVNTSVRFLDAVLTEYINKTENIHGMEAARRSAIKGRAIGIGVLGWHTLLQERGLPFDSFDTMQLNAQIFKSIHTKANEETAILAKELGEPEWCLGFGRRNTHLIACAPTVSNSIISGGHSAGIEPISANIFTQKSAKGTFIIKNITLEKLLEHKGKNTSEIWSSINEKSGSVQHLSCLSKEEKQIFLTAREINQHTLIKLAAQRQRWIDQGQSLNLFFAANSSPKYIHEVHLNAWKSGLKTLYYLRSDGVIKSDLAFRSEDECKACEA